MPPKRNIDINDVYDRIMARMEERLDQFVDQFVDRMNDMMNPRRRGDRDGRRGEGEELEYPFFESDDSSSDEWRDHDMAGDDYEGPLVFDDDQYKEESMPFYDTDFEDVIEEEEGFVRKKGFGVLDGVVLTTPSKGVEAFALFLAVCAKILLIIDIRLNNDCWKKYFYLPVTLVSEPKFLIKMPPMRNRDINDIYDRIMARMEERLDQFVESS
ncbi:hypothetical protein Tco_0908640 [Tanacetum coccineum]|uniref:Reverse transcriptase domain-containing protein n=1 Tax=Tanacetum coccineum TaxID=301880 RepID=A0ABQ5CMR9_9ASTR